MNSEQDLHIYLRTLFPPPSHYVRVETSTESGCPDVNICHRGVELWLELKYVEKGYPILRKEQYAWGIRRARAGGDVKILTFGMGQFKLYSYPRIIVNPRGDNKTLDLVSSPDVYITHGTSEAKVHLMIELFT